MVQPRWVYHLPRISPCLMSTHDLCTAKYTCEESSENSQYEFKIDHSTFDLGILTDLSIFKSLIIFFF